MLRRSGLGKEDLILGEKLIVTIKGSGAIVDLCRIPIAGFENMVEAKILHNSKIAPSRSRTKAPKFPSQVLQGCSSRSSHQALITP